MLEGTAKIDADLLGIYKNFLDAMDQDFNTPNAITTMQDLVKRSNQLLRSKTDPEILLSAIKVFDDMFTVFGLNPNVKPMEKQDKEIYIKWEKARKAKDFAAADIFRTELQEKGII
jgi:cysteinyl-tRNA synthetase